jgi:hypothetical protein
MNSQHFNRECSYSEFLLFLFISLLFHFFSFAGNNGQIEFSITAGNEDDFEIASNGTIYTRRVLDRETKSTYNLVVTARDCAKDADKRLSSTAQVKFKQRNDTLHRTLDLKICN